MKTPEEKRECNRLRSKKWAEANRDRKNKNHRDWYWKNNEHVKEWARNYYQANRDRLMTINRKWREANPEKVKQYALNRKAKLLAKKVQNG